MEIQLFILEAFSLYALEHCPVLRRRLGKEGIPQSLLPRTLARREHHHGEQLTSVYSTFKITASCQSLVSLEKWKKYSRPI